MNPNAHAPNSSDHAGHEHNDLAHVASAKMLITIFALLLFFTFLTVFLNKSFHFPGGLEVWIAMLIGTIKAVLVALFFMHLRYDRPFNVLVFVSAFLFVSIFIGFTLMDTTQYQRDVTWEDKSPKIEAPAAPATPAKDMAPTPEKK